MYHFIASGVRPQGNKRPEARKNMRGKKYCLVFCLYITTKLKKYQVLLSSSTAPIIKG
jgi:hypothetical protein